MCVHEHYGSDHNTHTIAVVPNEHVSFIALSICMTVCIFCLLCLRCVLYVGGEAAAGISAVLPVHLQR